MEALPHGPSQSGSGDPDRGVPSDPMAKYKALGATPDGLREFARMLMNNRQFGGGYAECVLKSAALEMERLRAEIAKCALALADALPDRWTSSVMWDEQSFNECVAALDRARQQQ